jgi:DNA-binding response OmpR family regulator
VSGFEVLDKLLKFSNVPVIVFTGQSFIANKAFKFGADDFIAKPFDPDALVEKMKKVLNNLNSD